MIFHFTDGGEHKLSLAEVKFKGLETKRSAKPEVIKILKSLLAAPYRLSLFVHTEPLHHHLLSIMNIVMYHVHHMYHHYMAVS